MVSEIKENSSPAPSRRHRPWWRRLLVWMGLTAAVVLGLFIMVCSLMVWILTPQRLTPIVEDYASGFLEADVRARRVELTFWSTFPRMTLDVDSLTVVSRTLSALPDSVRSALPADADSLLSLRSFHGALNVAALFAGEISVYDVTFGSPRVNLLQVTDSVANYSVFPESVDDASGSEPFFFPSVSVSRFVISDAAPLRFRSLPDSLDVTVSLRDVSIAGDDAPHYRFGLDGNLRLPWLDEFSLGDMALGAQGTVRWDSSRPMELEMKSLAVGIGAYSAVVDAALDFTVSPVVERLRIDTDEIPLDSLLRHIPSAYASVCSPLRTDMRLRAAIELCRPWHAADTLMPVCEGTIDIPSCSLAYGRLKLSSFVAGLHFFYNGCAPDSSVFTLRKLQMRGRSIDVSLEGSVADIVSDPRVEGRFRGNLTLANLPAELRRRLGITVLEGAVAGDAGFRFRLGDFTRTGFHRIYAGGKVQLRDVVIEADSSACVSTRRAVIDFGSGNSFVGNAGKVDSLLTLSVTADTLSLRGFGVDVRAGGLRAGAGTANRSSSADTAKVNPFGFRCGIASLRLDVPADSLRLRLRDASAGGALLRYNGDASLPQLDFRLSVGAMLVARSLSRMALREADVDLSMHMRPRRNPSSAPRRQASADSLASPAAPVDSGILGPAGRRLLRRWDLRGDVRASSGRFVTPDFPLRSRFSGVNLHFTQDSILLSDLSCRVGRTAFLVNGTVSGIRRALAGRRNNPLGMSLKVSADTIDVNEIVGALFASAPAVTSADEDWPDEMASAHVADTVAAGPLLVPRMLDARASLEAAHVLYSDLVLHSFKGNLMVYDGAVSLRDLSASTDIGSIRLDGLYSGASPDSLQLGMGMKVNRFRLDRLTSIVPAIDSLMPVMKSFAGTVNADVAVTADILPDMDIDIPSLRAAIRIEGDSLVLLDADTFKTLSKWLMFKNKKRNMIDHMVAEAVIENSTIELYPFMFDIDRYRLGVMGHNDLAMNLNYHVSVLKSPVPFKFGINIKGTPSDMKIRLGGARFKENMVGERQAIADNTRINIVEQIDNVFRRGISKARLGALRFRDGANRPVDTHRSLVEDFDRETISIADSLRFIRQGLIENPDTLRFPVSAP